MSEDSPDVSGAEAHAQTPGFAPRPLLGWACLAALLSYLAILYNGLASAPGRNPTEWWHPSSFLLEGVTVGTWQDESEAWGIFYLTGPALVLTAGVFWLTRSATARALALSSTCCSAIFAFYGLLAPGVWDFFHWRWSAVLVATGLALGFALAAPLFAERMIARPRRAVVLYALLAFAVMGLIRGATGTDESLFFNFAPWPAIPVLGLEVGAYAIAGFLAALGLGVSLAALGGATPVRSALGALCALCVPAIWFFARFPPGADADNGGGRLAGILVFVGALLFGMAITTRPGRERSSVLRRRGAHLALGALLVWMPLFVGRALANGDYAHNKFVRAKVISDGLQSYFQKQDEYPESLDELVADRFVEELPQPRVGFALFHRLGFSDRTDFSYRSLGSSYVLEFVSTEWVQCAYNPPWADEPGTSASAKDPTEASAYDDYDDYDDPVDTDGGQGGAWSCPDTRPELW